MSISESLSDIVDLLGLPTEDELYRQDNREMWDTTLQALPFIPAFYSHASIDYQLAYQRGQSGRWLDISIILMSGQRPCGVWPLSFSIDEGVPSVSSHGMPILSPLFVNEISAKSRKKLTKKCLDFLRKICTNGGVNFWESAESFSGDAERGLSEWHLQSMTNGASVTIGHELFVDLSLDIDVIKTYFRKSYKPLINLGLRTWNIGVLSEKNITIWDEFRKLHFNESGRVTRNSESWDMQHQAIVEGNAFLIYLRNDNDVMVGGGFFYITRDQGFYGVGVYDRSLFDKPLGHVVQFKAIEEMKKRGLRWYKIGYRSYPYDDLGEKYLAISEFKQGFATHFFPKYKLRNELEKD